MERLYFALLGSPKISSQSTQLTFSTRKALALLIYIAIEGGVHSRKDLSELFWPELESKKGRAVLRTTLLELRHLINDDPAPLLYLERDTIYLDPHAFALDIRELEASYQEACLLQQQLSLLKRDDIQQACQRLEAAACLYRGSFLAGFSLRDSALFDDWVHYRHDICLKQVQFILEILVQLYIETGNSSAATHILLRWISIDPFHEPAYQQLMRVYFSQGDRSAALKIYDKLCHYLDDELQSKPLPEITELADYMRVTDPPQERVKRPRHGPAVNALLPLNMPFVGRGQEFHQLIDGYTRAFNAEKSNQQVIIIHGDTGTGKTRLAHEFLGWAASQGADVMQGRSFDTGGRLAYLPFIEMVRQRLVGNGSEYRAGTFGQRGAISEGEHDLTALLSPLWLTELTCLLPELRGRYPELPLPLPGDALAQTRLFEALARLLCAFAAQRPLVLFLDDIQWADDATRDMLIYLVRYCSMTETSILLVACLCSQELVTQSAVHTWLNTFQREIDVTFIPLRPLSASNITQILDTFSQPQHSKMALSPCSEMALSLCNVHLNQEEPFPNVYLNQEEPLPKDILPWFSNWFLEVTDGYPWYLLETFNMLIERRLITGEMIEDGHYSVDFSALAAQQNTLRSLPIPTNIQNQILQRLERLSANARELLVACAVLHRGATGERLLTVAELSVKDGLAAIDEVLRAALLQETPADKSSAAEITYCFTHQKIREVVYAQASNARRNVFHARAQALLQSQAGILPIL